MSDIVDRLRIKDDVYTEFWQQRLMDEAADEIERLRARVTELKTCLTEHGAGADCDDFDCICHLCDNAECPCGERNNANFDRNYMAERALSDQLAEALREVSEVTKVLHGRGDLADCLIQAFLALAAYDAARKD